MAEVFALPDTNNQSIVDFIVYDNSITNGVFGLLTVFTIFIISYAMFQNFRTIERLTFASFVTAISSYFFSVMGFISPQIMLIPTILFVVGFLMMKKN